MQVDLATGGHGYIWVQRLYEGMVHACDISGALYVIAYDSTYCPLEETQ